MANLKDYIDGLLDSGAETFPREVLEKIKAMVGEPQVVKEKEYVYYPFWQWPPYQWQSVTTSPPKPVWITTGRTLDCKSDGAGGSTSGWVRMDRSGSIGSVNTGDISATAGGHAGRGAEVKSTGYSYITEQEFWAQHKKDAQHNT